MNVILLNVLYILQCSLLLTKSEELYGFLDLYKPEITVDILSRENPLCPGFECGPAALVALDKVHTSYAEESYGTNLKLLTFADVPINAWDRSISSTRFKKSVYNECGDEWKTGRCLERLMEKDMKPLLILGSHKDLSSQTSALNSYIKQSLFVQAATQLQEGRLSIAGANKKPKGWGNTIRFDPAITHDIALIKLLVQFKWTSHLTIFHDTYEAKYRADSFFNKMMQDFNLLDNSKNVRLGMYPVSIKDEERGGFSLDSPHFKLLWDNNKEEYINVTNTYFNKGDAIKARSRSELIWSCEKNLCLFRFPSQLPFTTI